MTISSPRSGAAYYRALKSIPAGLQRSPASFNRTRGPRQACAFTEGDVAFLFGGIGRDFISRIERRSLVAALPIAFADAIFFRVSPRDL